MLRISGASVDVWADFDHGEGSLVFTWPEEPLGYETLHIVIDGHCSRRNSMLSGNGPPDFTELGREAVRIRFAPDLARRLQWPEEMEIGFEISDVKFAELRKFIDFFEGNLE